MTLRVRMRSWLQSKNCLRGLLVVPDGLFAYPEKRRHFVDGRTDFACGDGHGLWMSRARKLKARWLSLLLRWGAKAAALDPHASAIGQLRRCEPPVLLRNAQCPSEKF